MVRDKLLKILFIPLLGLIIPFLSGVISYPLYSGLEIFSISLFFIFMSWCIWSSSAWLHHMIRSWNRAEQNIFIKISTISLTNSFFGGAIAGILSLVYFRISKETFSWTGYLLTIFLSVLAVIIFTLVYEILYLSSERALDLKVVHQLDRERKEAEMSNLKSELEPHFMFNSLNTLSHLILVDPATAHLFNSKLASVYKYFLINKDREMISVWSEIEFAENYFFLIKLRFEDRLNLLIDLDPHTVGEAMIVPFALQITLENAIKHNAFSAAKPLSIHISREGEDIVMRNSRNERSSKARSAGIGLRNLDLRYKLSWEKSISIEETEGEYAIRLPLIYQNHSHDAHYID